MTRRTAAATFAALAMLALTAWWLVRAPAIVEPVAQPPAIDIDPPAMRARRDAAIALATLPDDPWSFAQALAASAPDQAPVGEDCGVQDAPKESKGAGTDDEPVLMARPSQRHLAAQARLDAALRASSDPLERAVADLINVGGMRTEAGRDEAVVQQAAATPDARLYALGYGICHSALAPPPSCRALTPERWTEIDPGNGIPWVDMLAQAKARGDDPGVRSALSHLDSATRFDLYAQAAAGAVARHVPGDERDLAAANELVSRAAARAATLPLPPFQHLIQMCRNQAGGDERLAQSCRSISDVLFEHSDSLFGQAISGVLLQQTTADASRSEYIRTERAVLAAHWSPATGFSECREMRDSMNKLLRSAQVGEVAALREQARKFVTP